MSEVSVGPDSRYIANYLQHDVAHEMFELLKNDRDDLWAPRDDRAMFYRGHPLNRTKFFLVRGDGTDEQPSDVCPKVVQKYSYTGWQWKSLKFYRPLSRVAFIKKLVDDLRTTFEFDGKTWDFNHVIGTHYTCPADNIGFHDDKPSSLKPGSPILMFSLGAERDLLLRETSFEPQERTRVTLKSGSLFVLGPETNRLWQHAIPPVPSGPSALADASLPTDGSRISLVVRVIVTEVDTSLPENKSRIF